MRKSVLVASVPHTGTYFVYDNIFTAFEPRNIAQEPAPGTKHVRHIGEPDGSILERLIAQCFTIIPLRKFEAVQHTWARNGMDLSLLDRKWEMMESLKNVFRLQIDALDRNEQLADLSRCIDEPLYTDWRPINSMRIGK